ncbi:phenoloxidase-activating factor 2-like isoform X2 [Venturia canescens]|uniref:phenoloxidase-activating factor 2-like isoform X2 n=1 Tax=Venturia canescens TaxID=32260 RepID=UPI001C9BD548|nr:phenoloxidase-activating factor 2-like isoform X2 [Venturia canescens]
MWQLGILSGLVLASFVVAGQPNVSNRTSGCACIPFYACRNKNGELRYDVRDFGSCDNLLDVCCKWRDVVQQVVPLPSQQSSCQRTKQGLFPSMVALFSNSRFDVRVGSLIHPQAVLTAAFNIKNFQEKPPYKRIIVRADNQERYVDLIVGYNHSNTVQPRWNDLAILILSKPFDLGSNVNVACLPESEDQFNKSACFTLGLNYNAFTDQVIQKGIQLPIISREDCNSQIQRVFSDKTFHIEQNNVCSKGFEAFNMCEGFDGAPVACPVKNNPSQYVQVGVILWGPTCQKDSPTISTHTAGISRWIDEHFRPVPQRPQKSCGQRVNGKFQSVVMIVSKVSGEPLLKSPTGSLIHPQAVITSAARLLKQSASNIKVRAGGQERDVRSIINHENFRRDSLRNDLAILILSSPFDSAEDIDFACLPESEDQFEKSDCLTLGWNIDDQTSYHQWTQKNYKLPIMEREFCDYLVKILHNHPVYHIINQKVICTGGKAGINVCGCFRFSTRVD